MSTTRKGFLGERCEEEEEKKEGKIHNGTVLFNFYFIEGGEKLRSGIVLESG